MEFQESRYEASAGDGDTALLTLPPGTYYLTALSADGSVFGYYGPNPVQVRPGEEMAVNVRGLAGNEPPRIVRSGGESGVEGTVVTETGRLAGAVVAFYLDATKQFRGPAYMEVETDADGSFAATISPGRYFLVVRKRSGERLFGPLEIGDHFGYYAHNPLFLRAGEEVSVRLAAVEVLKRTGWSKPSPLRTRLSGAVRSREGRPLAGFRAFLHSRPEMLGRPEFISEESGTDGAWEIWAEREGTFYLGARKAVGEARTEGEALGYFEGTPDHSVVVRMDGRGMKGLDVIVEGSHE